MTPSSKCEESTIISDLAEATHLIVNLANENPYLGSKIALKRLKMNEDFTLRTVFSYLGWQQSKNLFPLIPEKVWRYLKKDTDILKRVQTDLLYLSSLLDFYSVLMEEFLISGGLFDSNNPFGFLSKVPLHEQKSLIQEQPAKSIAVMAFYLRKKHFQELFECCPTATQSQVIVALYHLDLPGPVDVFKMARDLEQRLNERHHQALITNHAFTLAARTLRRLPAVNANLLIEELEQTDPLLLECLRQIPTPAKG